MKRLYYILCLPVICMVLLQGCINDDLSDCPPIPDGFYVRFSYGAGTYAPTPINPQDIDRVDLFVFDKDGLFIDVYSDTNPNISTPAYYIKVPLPPNTYSLVAVCGLKDCYTTIPTTCTPALTRLENAQFLLMCAPDHSVRTPPHKLFFGDFSRALILKAGQIVTIPIVQNTNKIDIRSTGLPKYGDDYTMSIVDNNSHYYFDNSFAPSEELTYITTCGKDAQGQLQASLTVMRLTASRHPKLILTNTTKQTIVYQTDLVGLFSKLPGIDFATWHEFTITIDFNTDMSVDVFINGWKIIEDEPILH